MEISKFSDEFKLKKNANNLHLIDKAVSLILNDRLKMISMLFYYSDPTLLEMLLEDQILISA